MIRHLPILYQDLVSLVVRRGDEGATTRRTACRSYAGVSSAAAPGDEQVAAYSDLMAASQSLIVEQLLPSYSLRRHRGLLDVGGGTGAFLSAAARWPNLQLRLFDLPTAVAQAGPRLQAAGIEDRVELVGGTNGRWRCH
jgi:demethylspheroidene O-methyltransferase